MSFSIGYLLTPFEYNYLCVYFHPSELHFVYFDFVKTVSAFLLSATGVPRHFVYFDFVKTVSAFLLSATGVPRHSCNDFLLLLCSQAHYATDQWDYSLAALKIT